MIENISDDEMDLYYAPPVGAEELRRKKLKRPRHNSAHPRTRKRLDTGKWIYVDPQFKAFIIEISFEDSPEVILKESEGIDATRQILKSFGTEYEMSRASLQQLAKMGEVYLKIKLKSINFLLKMDYDLKEEITILPRGI